MSCSKRVQRCLWITFVAVFVHTLVTQPIIAIQEAKVAEKSTINASTTARLKEILTHLVDKIGERNLSHPDELNQAADYIERTLKDAHYEPQRQEFEVSGRACYNIIAEVKGSLQPDEIVLVGAHYDTAKERGRPARNSSSSPQQQPATAALLTIAEQLQRKSFGKTLRFVFFTNEEPPYFQRDGQMGSWVYARRCREQGDKLKVVISLETMGYYTDEKNSQKYPAFLASMYPDQGNFVGFVSNVPSRGMLLEVLQEFRNHCKPEDLNSEYATLPGDIQGVGWSDHWSFWKEDYSGLMITDTALFRYPHYHKPTDTVDKIEFNRYTTLVDSLTKTISALAK